MNTLKQEMKEFWGKGWGKRGQADKSVQSRERFLQELGAIRMLLEMEEGEQVREMQKIGLKGKAVLEIGCGAGSSSILFALDGAQVTASDLTDEAVAITKAKFDLLGLAGNAVQADAENLPFPDNSFDVVFSSGVLHHTPNTQKTIDEIRRVLKPGGNAVVMLYAKWSFQYLVSLLLMRGIIFGGIFRHGRNWLGHATELAWNTKEDRLNPMTKVYSGRQMRQLFKEFEIIGLRKHSFHWPDLFPGIYHLWKRRRVHLGDADVMSLSSFERVVGRFAGFALVIHARKPSAIKLNK